MIDRLRAVVHKYIQYVNFVAQTWFTVVWLDKDQLGEQRLMVLFFVFQILNLNKDKHIASREHRKFVIYDQTWQEMSLEALRDPLSSG